MIFLFLILNPFILCSLKELELTVIRGIPLRQRRIGPPAEKGISLIDISFKTCLGLYLTDVRSMNDFTGSYRGVPSMQVPVPSQRTVFMNLMNHIRPLIFQNPVSPASEFPSHSNDCNIGTRLAAFGTDPGIKLSQLFIFSDGDPGRFDQQAPKVAVPHVGDGPFLGVVAGGVFAGHHA